MQKVQFFALDRAVQDRFVNSSHGKEVPAPLLYERPRLNPRAVTLAGSAGALAVALLGFAVVGYGSLGHPLARAPLGFLGLYAGVSALAAALGTFAWRLFREDDKLPFLRGHFLYPVGVIEATEPELVVHELVTLKDMSVAGSQLTLTFESGKRFEFTLPNAGTGSAIETVLRQAQARASLPPGAQSHREGILQSPLLDTGYNNPFGPRESLRPEPRSRAVSTFALVVLAAAACGVGAFFLRNHLSERLLYAKARALDTTAAYRAYLASGASRADVVEVALPRAELREAVATGQANAIEAFLNRHPHAKIEDEAMAALKSALLVELSGVISKRSLGALRSFRAGDPRRILVEQERLRAETELYREALGKFRAASAQPEHAECFARLLEYTRKHGAEVTVRFRRRITESVEKVETQVRKSAYYIGPPALPKQYFDAARAEERERRVASALLERLQAIFPEDVLHFTLGEPIADDGTELPNVEQPTWVVTHRIDFSGPFTSTAPRGAFVGVGFTFKSALVIPKDPNPLSFQYTTWVPPNLRKLKEEHLSIGEMYGAMAADAFTRFSNKLDAALFRPPTR
jgi:hypothetical protein